MSQAISERSKKYWAKGTLWGWAQKGPGHVRTTPHPLLTDTPNLPRRPLRRHSCRGCFLTPNSRPLPHCLEIVCQRWPRGAAETARQSALLCGRHAPCANTGEDDAANMAKAGTQGAHCSGMGPQRGRWGCRLWQSREGGRKGCGGCLSEVLRRPVALSPAPLGRVGHPCCAHHPSRFVNYSRNRKLPVYYFSVRPRLSDAKIHNHFCGTIFKNQYVLYLKRW